MYSLPTQIPAPEQEIVFHTTGGMPFAEIFDTKTLTKGTIHKALSPSDKQLLGIPTDDRANLDWEHISKLILGHFYGPVVAETFHADLLREQLEPWLERDGGWLSSQDVYEWLQDKFQEADLDDGFAPR